MESPAQDKASATPYEEFPAESITQEKGLVALITGITGQDGSYLSEFLLLHGYEVHGIVRRSSVFNTGRIDHLMDRLHLHYGDLADGSNLMGIIAKVKPTEIYNLGAMSHVKVSFEAPEYTADVTGVGTLRLLEAVRACGLETNTRIYHASTSELFGLIQEPRQSETTPFYPRSPYGVAKLYAHWIMKNYRESYNIFCVSGILFNHESPRRGRTFVTRKITVGATRIVAKMQDVLSLGNLAARRDWGHAKDYVKAMWMMLQQDAPEDFVIGTGEQHTVKEFCEVAFGILGISIRWEGEGVNEKGFDGDTGKLLINVDPKYFRPAEVDSLLSNPSKAARVLGWKPEIRFHELVWEMVHKDAQKVGIAIGPFEQTLAQLDKMGILKKFSDSSKPSSSITEINTGKAQDSEGTTLVL